MIEAKVYRIVEDPPFKARSMKVRIGSKVFYTPERMLTKGEMESKRKVPTFIPINNPLVIIDIPLNISKIIKKDRTLNTHIEKIVNYLESIYGDLYGIHYLVPYLVPIGKPHVSEVLSSYSKFKEVYIKTLFWILKGMDAEYGFKSVFIPPLLFERTKYLKTLDYIMNVFEKYSIQTIPIIDLERDDFDKIITALINKEIKVIGLRYRSPRKKFKQYSFLSSETFIDKDVLFIMIDVKTHMDFRRVKDFATMHLLPFSNVDIVTAKIHRGGYADPTRPYNYNFRLMKRKTLQLPLIKQLPREEILSLLKELEIDLDNRIVSPIIRILSNHKLFEEWQTRIDERRKQAKEHEDWKEIRRVYEEYRSIYSFTRLQEVKASTKEFQFKKDFISKNDLEGYLNERVQLKYVVSVLKRLFP